LDVEPREYVTVLSETKEVETMRVRGTVFVCGIVLAAAAMSIGATNDQATADTTFDGAYVYNRSCASCHGASGEGVTLFGPPLAGDAFITASGDDAIGRVIIMGRKYRAKMYRAYSGMPRFQYITGGELQALIDYLKGPLQEMSKKAASG
jgi:mono/diheme cytochrome c family protein